MTRSATISLRQGVNRVTQLAAACPMGENTVAMLRSPSILTNIQIRR
jgi:hypothetical protein